MEDKPTGVTFLAVSLFLAGIFNIVGTPENYISYGILFAGYGIGIGVVNLIVGASLFSMQPWVRKGAMVTILVNMVIGIVILYWLATIDLWFAILFWYLIGPAILIPMVVTHYLMQGSVKDAFESHEPSGKKWFLDNDYQAEN